MATDRVVLCGGVPGDGLPFPDPSAVLLNRFGPEPNVRLQVEAIRAEMCRSIPDYLYDLLDIAAYVYAWDQAVPRGGPAADDNGAGWRRRLFYRVPVRAPDVWADPTTHRLLTGVLSFLSDDEYLFDFRPWAGDRPAVRQDIPFDADRFGGEVDGVAMFSGGLDSLAGAVEEVVGRGCWGPLRRHLRVL